MSAPRFGIEKLRAWPGTLAVDIPLLCEARGLDTDNFTRRLHCSERSVVGPHEDVVTMAVNAAHPMLTAEDRASIKLLIVATESAVDQEKPLSTWVHHFLGLPSDCRNFEVKHACYGATAGLQMALGFLASCGDPSAKALLVSTDHALIGIGGPQEPVLGAGAVAVLLSQAPEVVSYELGKSGVYAHEIADIFRPAPGVETGDADESLLSYLDGAERTWEDYVRKAGGDAHFDRNFAAHIYHVPFGGLAERAHLRLCKRELEMDRKAGLAHFRAKVEPSLIHNRRMGGTYGASTFIALLGLVESMPSLSANDRISIYSYGSGSCAEFYAARLLDGARAVAEKAGLRALLDERRMLTLSEYEACERALHATIAARNHQADPSLLPGHFQSHYEGRGRLVYRGIADYRRTYEWS
ncbi:MAG: hydroxymethylglutaryl-CoA synthase [Polyangiaceae bacterium]